MKKIISLFAMAALVSVAVGSCTVEPPRDSYSEDGYIVFTASQEPVDGTRTEVSGTKVLWSPGDSISVFYKTEDWNGGTKFINTATSPSATADFSGVLNNLAGGTPDGTSWFAAISPYRNNNGFSPAYDGSNPGVSISIPNRQTAVPASFDPKAFFSVAVSKDTHLQFYNVCGGIALTFGGGCQDYTSVTIKSNLGDMLAADIGIYLDNPSEPKMSENYWEYGEITLESPAGGFQPGVEYLVSTIPTVLREGFSVLFRRSDGKIAIKKFTKPQTIYRSTFGRISGFDTGLEWVEEKTEDAMALVSRQWKDAKGNILDFNTTLPGRFVVASVDNPTYMSAYCHEITSAVKNVYGNIVLYNGESEFFTFVELSGDKGRLYQNSGPGVATTEYIFELTAVDPPIALQAKDLSVIADGVRYHISSNDAPMYEGFKKIADSNDGKLPIVFIDAYGTAADFAAVNVSGKVAIVNRGEINFSTKALNAQAAGAIGILFVNTSDDPLYPSMGSSTIPGAGLPKSIKSHLAGKTYLECVPSIPSDL